MRAAGNLAGVTFLSPPQYHPMQDEWREIITESGYFFTADSMRFFSSRILWDSLESVGDGFLFVTSERHEYSGEPRKYTVRSFYRDKGTNEVSGFQAHATSRAAMKEIEGIVKAWVKSGCNA